MRGQPRSQPIPRVTRSRRDDHYQAGRETPHKHAYAGWVQSVEDDTCTVEILGEVIPGVIYLGDPPEPGAVVEVEARGNLLVIPFWYPGPPPWETLPDVVRVMVPTGYTTPQGTDGWAPSSFESNLHSTRLAGYRLDGPVFNPTSVFDDPAAWACAYSHAFKSETGSSYYNTPPSEVEWTGSASCEPLHGATATTAAAPSGLDGASWRVVTNLSGSADDLRIENRSTVFWVDLATIKTSTLGAHIGDPSAGLPDPTPPVGFALEWESPTSTLTKIEAAIAEPSTNTNTGAVYLRKITPGTGGWGPTDPTGVALDWLEGNATAGGSIVPAYSGGAAPWTEVTSQVNTTGKTWFMFVSSLIHDHSPAPSGGHPLTQGQERLNLRGAFRFSVTPSRYRFVPIP